MIRRVDIDDRVREWGLRDDVVEKDYVLGWVLWGIGTEPALFERWIFKGGTCLKKCYIETYRFSEDCWAALRRGVSEMRANVPARNTRYDHSSTQGFERMAMSRTARPFRELAVWTSRDLTRMDQVEIGGLWDDFRN